MNDSIHVLMGRVMADVEEVRKGGKHEKQGYSYRTVDDIANAAGAAMRKHGIFAVPVLESIAYEATEVGKQRTATRIAQVQVTYQFFGPNGDHVDAIVAAESMDSGDKATPKAMSVAYRIALSQVLSIPTGDPDPAETNFKRSEPWTAAELGKTAVANRRNRTHLLSTHNVAKRHGLLDDLVANEDNTEEPLGEMIQRFGKAIPKRTAKRKPIETPEPELTGDGDE